jgi:protein TonB
MKTGFACLSLLLILPLASCGKADAPAAQAAPASTEVAAVHTPPPDYPIELACAGQGGTTVLKVVVGPEGKPTDVQIQQSSGQPALDQAAQTRVTQDWTFNPATRAGQPVATTIQVPVTFNPPQPRPDQCFALDEHAHPQG